MAAEREETLNSMPGDDEASSRAPRAGEVLASKYRVERVVGRGGMGVVVAARHLKLGQTVAVKLLTTEPASVPDATARFLREAQAAAALSSDHVVRIYDVGQLDDGAPFMVMEYLRGDDLSTLIEQHGPQPVPVAVEYVCQACDAIAEAHAHGIIHRDLKPSNLFVTVRSDGTPHVKVLDFGISKSLRVAGSEESFGGNLTATRTVLGSPYYMSPEQVRDAKNVDVRSDVWALGVILYELLAGRPPFEGDTLPAVCAAIAADRAPSLRSLGVDCPEALDAIVLRCLEKNPDDRFQSVDELAAALQVFTLRDGRRSLTAISSGHASRAAMRISSTPEIQSTLAVAPATDRTMVSGGVEADPGHSADTEPAGSPDTVRKRSPLVWLVAIAGVAAAGGLAALALRDAKTETPGPGPSATVALPPVAPPPPAPAEKQPPAARDSFEFLIESSPPGAEVYEGDVLLGKTPIEIAIAKSTVSERPRSFVLRKPGYLDLTVVQGDSSQNVRFSGALVPAPTATPPAPAPRPKPQRKPEPKEEPTPPPKPAAPDIRMQR